MGSVLRFLAVQVFVTLLAAVPEKREIEDASKVFSAINGGDALKWPTDFQKEKAGQNAWGDWKPENGMVGEVIHSWGESKHLLKIDTHFCVVAEGGLKGQPAAHTVSNPPTDWDKTKVQFVADIPEYDTFRNASIGQGYFGVFYSRGGCAGCKTFKKILTKAAALMERDDRFADHRTPFMAIDCSSNINVCARMRFKQEPAFLHFTNKSAGWWQDTGTAVDIMSLAPQFDRGNGPRALARLIAKHVRQSRPLVPDPTQPMPACGNEELCGGSVPLNDHHFAAYRKDHPRMLVMFHGHGLLGADTHRDDVVETFKQYGAAASKFSRSLPFATVDCDLTGEQACAALGVTSFPFPHIAFLDGDKEPEVLTARTGGDFLAFAEGKLNEAAKGADGQINYQKLRVKQLKKMLKEKGLVCSGCTDKSEFVAMLTAALEGGGQADGSVLGTTELSEL
jgi:hypothetical protein